MRFEVVTSVAEWLRRGSSISALLSTSRSHTAHSTLPWLRAWWLAFGSHANLRVALLWKGTSLLGYAPLMLTHYDFCGVSYRSLRFIGEGRSDYADVFSLDDDISIKVEMIQRLLREPSWDDLSLMNVRETSTTAEAVVVAAAHSHLVRIEPGPRCPYVDLTGGSFDNYLAGRDGKFRRDLRRRLRHLDSLGEWQVDFNPRIAPELLFEEFRQLHGPRARSMGWAQSYEDPHFRHFLIELLSEPRPAQSAVWSTLRHRGTLISYTLGFVTDGVYYQWNVGFSPAFAAVSPNKLHHLFLLRECFARGYREFDFMRSDHRYKMEWTSTVRQNIRIRLLRQHGWRRPLNRIQWLKEREVGSLVDKCINVSRAARSLIGRNVGQLRATTRNET